MLETIWFALWGVLWGVYFMLDGFDLGLGSIMPFVAKDDTDYRIIYNAQGPFWDGNEVWLITAGGVTFAAFPGTYAVMFSSLYTPLMLILFALILRGVSFELRGKMDGPGWKKIWDVCQFVGSFLPALLFGVAFANIFAGVPIDKEGILHGNLFSLLTPYGLLGGLVFLTMFAMHGSLWLMVKTGGNVGQELRQRTAGWAKGLWFVVLALAVIFLIASWFATNLYANYLAAPALFLVLAISVACLLLAGMMIFKGSWGKAFLSSCGFILFCTLWGVGGLYPNLLPSSIDPAASMTAFNSSSSPLTLKIMLGVALVMVPVVILYQLWAYMRFKHPLNEEDLAYEEAY